MAGAQPKKPAGGAFGQFLADKRCEIRASMPEGHKMTDITKKASELFKSLSEEERQVYQTRFEKAQETYKEAMEAFKAGGGVVERKVKQGKKAKAPKDSNAPKKPAGGAFGRFLAEKRAEIVASLPEGHKITEIPKKASELFQALSDEEKQKYQALFEKAQADYKTALEEYKAKNPTTTEATAEAETTPRPRGAAKSKARAKAEGKARVPKVKADKVATKAKAPVKAKAKAKSAKRKEPDSPGVTLSEAVLRKARDLGFEAQLKNLAARQEVASQGKSAAELLAALTKSNGLVNPAKRALLGGA